jgi:regulator of sigma E protease
MATLVTIISFVFVLSILIVFHEGGHFLLAKLFRFPVEVFSVGFGKRLFGFKWRETDYRISAIPLGGYVKVVGLGPDETDIVDGQAAEAPQTGARWQRLLVLFAGPAFNVVLAVLLTAGAFMSGIEIAKYQEEKPVVKHIDAGSPAEVSGVKVEDEIVSIGGRAVSTWRDVELDLGLAPREEIRVGLMRQGQPIELVLRPEPKTKYDIGYTGLNPDLPPVVARVVAGYPGEKAGLKQGDKVLAVAGKPVGGYYEIVRRLREAASDFDKTGAKPVEILVDRGGQQIPLQITPRKEGNSWKIGFAPKTETIKKSLSLIPALQASYDETLRQARTTFATVGRLVTGRGSMRQLSGPLEIARFSGEAARSGLAELLTLMGMLSLQLGLLNLLPIPMLDGGQITILLMEAVARRDFSLKVKERLLQAGFVFLVLLMATVLVLDVAKKFNL